MISKLFAAVAVSAGIAAAPALAQDKYPDPGKRLNWTISFGPGGGNDIMSRTIISILEKHKLYPGQIVAENRPGGSGAKGWGYVFSQKGDPYHITSTSGSFITTPLQANTPWQPTSFTPIALLATDDMLMLVNKNSKARSLKDFVAAAKSKPPSIGGIGTVNIDFIVPKLVSEKAGFKFEYVSFNKQGELITALLSGALDAAMSNPGEVLGLIQSGDMHPIAYSGKATPKALGDVPTFGKLGYDIGIALPRGLVLPPDVPKQAQQWWIGTMKKVVQTPEWKAYIEKNVLTENVLYAEEFRTFLQRTQGTFRDILKKQGAIK